METVNSTAVLTAPKSFLFDYRRSNLQYCLRLYTENPFQFQVAVSQTILSRVLTYAYLFIHLLQAVRFDSHLVTTNLMVKRAFIL